MSARLGGKYRGGTTTEQDATGRWVAKRDVAIAGVVVALETLPAPSETTALERLDLALAAISSLSALVAISSATTLAAPAYSSTR